MVMAYSSDTDNFLKGNKEFGFEAGVLLNYALGRNFALNLELSSQLNKEKAFALTRITIPAGFRSSDSHRYFRRRI